MFFEHLVQEARAICEGRNKERQRSGREAMAARYGVKVNDPKLFPPPAYSDPERRDRRHRATKGASDPVDWRKGLQREKDASNKADLRLRLARAQGRA